MNLLDNLRIIGAWKDKVLCGPKSIYIDITTACNINCNFCWIHSSLIKKKYYKKNRYIEFDRLKEIILEISTWKTEEILLSGDGEPTLHPDINRIIDYITEKKIHLFLTTNATFPLNFIPNISRVNYLYINLCAPNEKLYHETQSPRNKFLYSRIIQNLKILSLLNKQYKKPFLNIAFIINKTNYKNIPKMLDFCENLKINQITFRIMEPIKYTQKLLLSENEKNKLIKLIKAILTNKYSFEHNLKDIKEGLIDYKKSVFNIKRCYTGWFNLFVDFNGNVGLCCHNENLIVDNLNNASLKEIWESTHTQKLRLKCKHRFNINVFPFKNECNWCHWNKENTRISDEIKKIQDVKSYKKNYFRNHE